MILGHVIPFHWAKLNSSRWSHNSYVHCYYCTAAARQSYSRITDESSNRASHVAHLQVNDGSPMRNGDSETDDARRGSVCKYEKLNVIEWIAHIYFYTACPDHSMLTSVGRQRLQFTCTCWPFAPCKSKFNVVDSPCIRVRTCLSRSDFYWHTGAILAGCPPCCLPPITHMGTSGVEPRSVGASPSS